jgi:alcohol oxidase
MQSVCYNQGELELAHPKILLTSAAAFEEIKSDIHEGGKSRMDWVNLKYSVEGGAAMERFIRENSSTTWHSLGTCAMRPRNEAGVVDKNLDVYGVANLKMAGKKRPSIDGYKPYADFCLDLSIPPENIAANTNNTALGTGEKAAVIILRELGLVV